ncbi:DUF4276 family protein [Gammaproteobacteria bacterium]
MRDTHLEILVEEPSMEAFLRALLPRMLGNTKSFELYPHQGKHDLLHKLPARLKGYAHWLPETWRILVVVDRDDDDCHALKQRVEQMVAAAGLRSRSVATAATWQVASRIAIEELEAWYFGDWEAVRAIYPRISAKIPEQKNYRDPDAVAGGTWETFERVLQKAGYFKSGLRKTEAARTLGGKIEPARNRSRSFQVFRDAILEAVA